jgi:hypothetical protein
MPTDAAQQALSILRDASQFQWYVIPFFAMVVLFYFLEIEKRNWNAVFAGLALWGTDWFFEILNALIFHFTQKAPLWGAPGDTAYLLLIGLNIEISMMFAIAGIAFTKVLPRDKKARLLGLPNRLVCAMGFAAFCVFVEILLNLAGALTWDYPFWCARAPWLIFAAAYFPLIMVAYLVHDLETLRGKAIAVGGLYALDILALAVFAGLLGWI